jgi:hypothetical protein
VSKSQDNTVSIGILKQICKDLSWECEIVLEMVILALLEKRFWLLAPKKEEWVELRIKSDALDLLSNMLRAQTGRHWSHEEVIEFRDKLELEFFHPARKEISFETHIQLLFNKEQECALCGTKGVDMIPEIDHRKPIRRGGSSQYSNLQWLCRSCNRKKQAKIGKEWENA